MAARLVKSFTYREFEVKLAEIGPARFKAVAREIGRSNEVEHVADSTIELVEIEIKQRLKARSSSYVGLDEAMRLFQRAFPKGFQDPFYREYERDYKDHAAAFVEEHLSQERLDEALDHDRYSDICTWSRQVYSKTNLISQFESARLAECHREEGKQEPFARAVRTLLYGADFSQGIAEMVHILSSHGAATWPVVTYLPFFRFADRHMFLKPEVTRECADRLGIDLEYDPKPNIETYRSLLKMVAEIRAGIAVLQPKDNIDVQSMIWVLGSKGYVAAAEKERAARI